MIKFFKSLIKSDTKESSKRFVALYTMIVLVTFIVVRYTNTSNIVMVLVQLLSFIVATLGVATWQSIKRK